MKNSKYIPLKQIMDDAKNCEKSIKISDIANIFEEGFAMLYNSGTILKKVEKKIGEEDFNILITSLGGTIMSTIYANANFDTKEEMIEYAKVVNASKVYGVKE